MAISYVSTRGRAPAETFGSALLAGLAPDGGLYVPDRLVPLDQAWKRCASFADLGHALLKPYAEPDVDGDELRELLREALSFPVPLVALEGKWEGVFVLELFHGPTQSFKDFGAQTMARLMERMLSGDPCTILVATSGDTGSAVAAAFSGRRNIRVVLLYPDGQVSPTQENQITLARPGVRAFRVGGTFDDCQRMVKAALASNLPLRLSAANSINIGRLLPQMIYYAWAFASADLDGAAVCVPCGNLGNLTAGVLAALKGLPIARFIAAHNANDGFPRFLAGKGEPQGASVRTLSNAMDVAQPSNFERLKYLIPAMSTLIEGHSITDASTLESIRRVYEETGYVCDPHTAVALEAVRRQTDRPALVLATAHPAKFPEVAQQALGWVPEAPEMLREAAEGNRCVESMEPADGALARQLVQGFG